MERTLKFTLPDGRFLDVSPVRSRTMSAIRGRNNKTTESRLRMALVRQGIRGWVLHADLPGRPDFYFRKKKIAVFVDGCFWHACHKCGHTPKTRSVYWTEKLRRNKERDRRNARTLRKDGVTVLRVWEHQLKTDRCLTKVVESVRARLGQV